MCRVEREAGGERSECGQEAPEGLRVEADEDVEITGEGLCPVDDGGDAADDDEGDAGVGEKRDKAWRVLQAHAVFER